MSSTNDGCEPVACKILDCDTVTQAKEKALDAIYRNTPFSQRPAVHHLDLGKTVSAHFNLLSARSRYLTLTQTFSFFVTFRYQFLVFFTLLFVVKYRNVINIFICCTFQMS